jgi:hypothetical protein
MANDPWKHRSTEMKCATCMWFVKKSATQPMVRVNDQVLQGDERGALGRCRRHAPTMNGFPVVFESDWCGDHRLDETKI